MNQGIYLPTYRLTPNRPPECRELITSRQVRKGNVNIGK